MNRVTAMLMIFTAAFFWGSGNVANKTVLQDVGPLTAVSIRCLIATLVVLPWSLAELQPARAPDWGRKVMGVSVLFGAALALQQMAYLTATVTNASFLVNTCSILTPILAWVWFGESPSVRIICAAAVTLSGAFFMTGGSFSVALMTQGDVLCLLSAAFYAAWMVALGQLVMAHGRPFATCLMQFALTGIILLPIALWAEDPTLPRVLRAAPELLVLGFFSTGIAFVLLTRAQQAVSSSTAAVIVSAESLFGAAGAYFLLGEVTPAMGVFGAALILTGIIIAAIGARITAPARQSG